MVEHGGGPQSLLCLYLLSCFASDFPKFSLCPSDCQCFKAPQDGFMWNTDDTISLICETPPPNSKLRELTQYKLNSFVLNSSIVYELEDGYFDQLSISSIVLSDVAHQPKIHSMSFNTSLHPFAGFVNNSLKSLTFMNLNINTFSWKPFNGKKSNLELIHIENCVFEKLGDEFVFENVLSLTIDNSHLEFIKHDVFVGWNRLRLLRIANNPLKSLDWRTPNLLSNLLHLNLFNNSIDEIPDDFFQSMKKLRTLNLDSNNIKFLRWKDLYPFPKSLKEFSIEDNYFCANTAMLEVFNNTVELMNTTDFMPVFFFESIFLGKCIKPSESINWPVYCVEFFRDPESIKENECTNHTLPVLSGGNVTTGY